MPKNSDWDRVRGLVFPELCDDPARYERLVADGVQRAQEHLRSTLGSRLPRPDDLRDVHRIAFADVHPSAGRFKALGEENRVGRATWDTAHSSCVSYELDRLGQAAERLRAQAKTSEALAASIAFFSAQAWRIQPFLDGNSRVLFLIAQEQARALLGAEPTLTSWTEYKASLLLANNRGDLAPLAGQLTGVDISLSGSRYVNYQRELWPSYAEKQLPNGLTVRELCPDFATAELYARAVPTARYIERVGLSKAGESVPPLLDVKQSPPVLDVDVQRLERQRDFDLELER